MLVDLTEGTSSAVERFVNSYVGYSMARHLRKYIVPKGEQLDPELDVEAHLAERVIRDARSRINKKKRLQCISGWLWCKTVLLFNRLCLLVSIDVCLFQFFFNVFL